MHPNVHHRGTRRPGELTPLQRVFVDTYLQTFSARKAAEAAGYADPTRHSWILMRTPEIVDAISKGQIEMRRRNEHLEDQVLQELAAMAFCDMSQFVNFDDNTLIVKSLNDIPESVRGCIKKVTVTPGKNGDKVAVELHDKMKPLELIGKYMNIWGEGYYPGGKREQADEGQKPIQVVTGIPRPPDGEDWSDL